MKNLFILFLFILALVVFIMSSRFLNFEDQGILLDKPDELVRQVYYRVLFYTHVIAGMIALITGPFQFVEKWRNRFLNTHRLLGKIYLLAILFGGISGLIIAFYANGGWISASGFFFLAVFWLVTGTMAYRTIKAKQVAQHEIWMVRNYAFTYAAVTLRLGLLLAMVGLVKFIVIYQIVAWASWLVNILIVETFIIPRLKSRAN